MIIYGQKLPHEEVLSIRDQIKEISDIQKSFPGEKCKNLHQEGVNDLPESHVVKLTEEELKELKHNTRMKLKKEMKM